jgi:hypothetical protein
MSEIMSEPRKPSEARSLPKLGFTMRQTAEIIGVSYMTVFRLAKRGLLRPSKALRTKIFSAEEIQRFLRETV